ncbi:MAG: class I SAM-dependent methyltransferase [Lacibacter sp.]
MFEFHTNRKRYFDIQYLNAKQYVIPFIEKVWPLHAGMRVLEIGCGEGGVLKAFVERDCNGVGVELDGMRLTYANEWMQEEIAARKVFFISKDIYKTDAAELGGKFDLIVLKDVIEHIPDQKRLMQRLKELLLPGGAVYLGFPPWYMPYGGHQQICKNKWLSRIPYYHLLPRSMYRYILRKAGENVQEMMEIRDTGISIERFERICKETGYAITAATHYLINPIYEYKFGWKARRQFGWVQRIPCVRNFVTTCVYYLVQPQIDTL